MPTEASAKDGASLFISGRLQHAIHSFSEGWSRPYFYLYTLFFNLRFRVFQKLNPLWRSSSRHINNSCSL